MTQSDRMLPATQDFSFYTSSEYYEHITEAIKRTESGDRVLLMSLWIRAHEAPIEAMLKAAIAAADRGVKVTLIVDAFTFLIKSGVKPGPAFYFGASSKYMPKVFQERLAMLDQIQKAGGRYAVINQPKRAFRNPFQGRSHIKFTVVNDEIFVGGCNLSNTNFLDVMVGWHNSTIADWLAGLAEKIMRTGNVAAALEGHDVRLSVDAHTDLVIDAGVPDQSLILEEALAMIAQARKKLLITFQYCPQGPTANALHEAHDRGVKLEAIYNHPGKHGAPLNIVFGGLAWYASRGRSAQLRAGRLTKQHNYLHAKIIATEHGAILGSHNYMPPGVRLGTAEIALVSRDPSFADRASETLRRQLS